MSTPPIANGPLARWLGRAHGLLHYDFCPWANRWVYWMKHPLWSLTLALAASLVCGAIVNPNVLIVSGVLAACIALGSAWPWVVMGGIRGALHIEHRRCREQQPVTVRLRITNRWPFPAWGLFVEGGFFDDHQPVLALSRAAGWSTCEFDWTFVPQRRGIYPRAVPLLATKFPFGLVRAARPVEAAGRLVVWPETCPLTTLPDAVELDFREDRLSDRQAGEQGDLLGTRLFRQGDSLRRVHWAQTARHGRLIVCEKQSSARCAVRMIVDIHAVHHRGAGTPAATLETTLRAAASICEALHRQHAVIECWLGRERFEVGEGAAGFRAFMDALAAVPPEGVDSGLPSRAIREDVWTVALTTETGRSSGVFQTVRRVITITSQETDAAAAAAAGSWLALAPSPQWREEFARRWRRACRVA